MAELGLAMALAGLILVCLVLSSSIRKQRFDFYLAGPMRGYENLNKAMFLNVATLIREGGQTVFNPAEVNDDNMDFEDCMKVDLDAVINKCNKIVFLPNWTKSEGANAEALVAFVCGKPAYTAKVTKKSNKLKLVLLDLTEYTVPYGGESSDSLTPRTKRKK